MWAFVLHGRCPAKYFCIFLPPLGSAVRSEDFLLRFGISPEISHVGRPHPQLVLMVEPELRRSHLRRTYARLWNPMSHFLLAVYRGIFYHTKLGVGHEAENGRTKNTQILRALCHSVADVSNLILSSLCCARQPYRHRRYKRIML
jgi:hypothetical protein